jgi:hypothetical protein
MAACTCSVQGIRGDLLLEQRIIAATATLLFSGKLNSML